jgi:hypothetical protein
VYFQGGFRAGSSLKQRKKPIQVPASTPLVSLRVPDSVNKILPPAFSDVCFLSGFVQIVLMINQSLLSFFFRSREG